MRRERPIIAPVTHQCEVEDVRRTGTETWKVLPTSEDLKQHNASLLHPGAQLVGAVDLLQKTQGRLGALLLGLSETDRLREVRRLESGGQLPIPVQEQLETGMLGKSLDASIANVERALDLITETVLDAWPEVTQCKRVLEDKNAKQLLYLKEDFEDWLGANLDTKLLN